MKNLIDFPVYAAWNNDTIERLKSSSGGMFSAFAFKVISEGGVVYAVAETEEGLVYQRAEDMNDIIPMHGSKYYQAKGESIDTELLYKDVDSSKPVLLMGTSCQAGMFSAIIAEKYKYIPENVIIVDIICHGVGSKKSVDLYRNELEKRKGKLLKHTFRNKESDRLGSQFSEYSYISGDNVCIDNDKDYYMRFFFPGFFLRPSCYECIFSGRNKVSDISIGDFNGASRVVKEFPDNTHCVSAVIVNSLKGKYFLDDIIYNKIITVIKTDYDTVASQNLTLKNPTKRPWQRDYAFILIDKIGFINACRLLSGKYYIRNAIKLIGGDKLLNTIKRRLGRIVIEY